MLSNLLSFLSVRLIKHSNLITYQRGVYALGMFIYESLQQSIPI